jgi:cytochrome c553
MRPWRRTAACFALCIAIASAAAAAAANGAAAVADDPQMQALYRQGVLPSGAALRGARADGRALSGADAACANCHRRSGLGAAEGQLIVPPITGQYLFRPMGGINEDLDYHYAQGYINLKRQPYTERSLADAIRKGIGRDGRPLNVLMPRFQLDDATLSRLTGYLRGLSATLSPGVTPDTLHFATIITPDADPAARAGMLKVLQQFFADKNAFLRGGGKTMRADRNMFYRVTRRWQLHVWELTGAPATWEQQLRRKLAEEPVFAVISGIGGKTWDPIHRFCQAAALPCLFPNVDRPVVAEQDFYDVYFSRGVLLESDVIAGRLLQAGTSAPRRLVQVFRRGDIGADAARQLAGRITAAGRPQPVERALPPHAVPGDVARAVKTISAHDVLVLWLRPADLAALPADVPTRAVYASGLMGDLEQAPLPAAWRPATLLAYPAELPARRRVAMDFPLSWFRIRQVPVTAERVQVDTYLACQILSETLGGMLDLFYRDYLVEQLENMLSRRLVNGYFPRLGLAPGQRFASKGSYLVRLGPGQPPTVSAASPWIIP